MSVISEGILGCELILESGWGGDVERVAAMVVRSKSSQVCGRSSSFVQVQNSAIVGGISRIHFFPRSVTCGAVNREMVRST